MPDVPAGVTPEEIVAAILVELEKGVSPGHYVNYVRNVFKVYLSGQAYRSLLPLKDRIREEAVRALQEELGRLNGARGMAGKLPFQKKQRSKRCEVLGDWLVEFHTNEDDDAAQAPLIVYSDYSRPPENGSIEGPPTVRVTQPGLDESSRETRRTGLADPAKASGAVYAQFTYEDDGGSQSFDMVKEIVKVGRGGPNEWVDMKLFTTKDVSREHFQVRRDAKTGKFFIKDLSKFGTWVNGARVPPSIEIQNNEERDKNIEEPLPVNASINLADILTIQFKALRK